MPEDNKPAHDPKTKILSDDDILNTDNAKLSFEQLQRKLVLIDINSKVFHADLVNRQISKMKMEDDEQRDKFYSRGRELTNTKLSRQKHQEGCSHLKGGKGMQALQTGGTDMSDAALIRHLFPHGEWWVRCQRCAKTWRPPHVEDFDMKTEEGRAAYEDQKKQYDWAMKTPTNNSPSTGHQYSWTSADDNKTAKKMVREAMRDVNLQ